MDSARSTRAALLIGLLAILGGCAIGWFSHNRTRGLLLSQIYATHLAVAERIGSQPPDLDRAHALEEVVREWELDTQRHPSSFVCAISSEGTLIANSKRPEKVGANVGSVSIAPFHGGGTGTVGDLARNKESWVGFNKNHAGFEQLAAYAYSSSIDGLVAVHVPRQVVEDQLREASLPWFVGGALMGLLLLPISIFLLHRTHRSIEDELARRSRELLESRRRYETLYESAPDMFLSVCARTGRMLLCNDTFAAAMGYTKKELLDQSVTDLLAKESREAGRAALDSFARGEHLRDVELTFASPRGPRIAVSLNATLAGGHEEACEGEPAVQVVARDVSELRAHQERQKLLMRELDHRVKNTLASVIAVAQQSMGGNADFPDFQRSFVGRVLAMARTHEAIAAAHWTSVGLAEIVEMVTRPHLPRGAESLELEGDPVFFIAQAATPLAMALHELTTNAVKHGSLGSPDARLRVRWSIAPDGVHIVWSETGGPAPRGPLQAGVGMTLVHGMVEYELGGSAHFDSEPGGLTCTLLIPSDRLLGGEPREVARALTETST